MEKSPGRDTVTEHVTPSPAIEHAYYVGQRKEELDLGAPLWQRLFFSLIYRPFLRFCYFKLGIPAFSGADRDGTMFWLEHQSICHSRSDALRLANRPGWYFHALPVDSTLPASTCACQDHDFPLSHTELYEHARNPTVQIKQSSLAMLETKVTQGDDLVRRFKVANTL